MAIALGIDYDTVDTEPKFALGTIGYVVDSDGYKEYVYFKGVASCAAGSWVTLDENFQAVLSVLNAFGATGIAQAAVLAANWGWAQIYGKGSGLMLAACADNAGLWTSATAGSLDDTATSQTLIMGAVNRSLIGGAPALGPVSLFYPVATPTTP